MHEFALNGCSIESQVFFDHRRGINWAAFMTGKIAANAQRSFLSMKGRIADLSNVKPGDVVEFGGDYITSGGRREINRQWWLVHQISDESLKVEIAATLASAMKAARVFTGRKETHHG